MQSESWIPEGVASGSLHAELESLGTVQGLLSGFQPALEQQYQRWLSARMLSLLRHVLPMILLLVVAVMICNVGKVYLFTPEPMRSNDIGVYWAQTAFVAVVQALFAFCLLTSRLDPYVRHYVIAISIAMLSALAVSVLAYTEIFNRLYQLTNFWITIAIIFCTGLHSPRNCGVIAVMTLMITVLAAWLLGLTQGLLPYALLLLGSGLVAMGFALIMSQVYRQIFLQEGILVQDKDHLTLLSEQLAELSLKDALTGVANRRRFDELLDREWGRAERQSSSLALLFIDVDNFKAYNDHYGHQAGDDCLRAVAFVLADAGRRQSDLVARYGGEEFVLLLPDTDMDGAMEAAVRICSFLEQAALPHVAVPHGRVTASIGVAACIPASGKSPRGLVKAADAAVYAAKSAGRNCIKVAGEEGFAAV